MKESAVCAARYFLNIRVPHGRNQSLDLSIEPAKKGKRNLWSTRTGILRFNRRSRLSFRRPGSAVPALTRERTCTDQAICKEANVTESRPCHATSSEFIEGVRCVSESEFLPDGYNFCHGVENDKCRRNGPNSPRRMRQHIASDIWGLRS